MPPGKLGLNIVQIELRWRARLMQEDDTFRGRREVRHTLVIGEQLRIE